MSFQGRPEEYWTNWQASRSNTSFAKGLVRMSASWCSVEMFYGQPPDTSRLKTFGAECWLHMPVKNRAGKDKQSANGSGGNLQYRFVGIPRGTKGYMIMDTTAKPHPRILVRQSVHFQEDMSYIHDNADSSSSSYTEDSSYTSDSEDSHTSGMPDISTLSYSSGSESDSSSSDSSYISSDSALYCATSSSSSSSSDSSSSDGGADQLGANNPLGPNAPQPKAAQQPPPATASSSSSATSGSGFSSSYSDSSDSRGQVVTTLHNDTLRTVAARHDIDVVLLQSLNNMDNKPVPLSAKFKTNTELFLPSQLELDAWELARFSRLKGHDSLEGSAKIDFTGIWSDSDHNTGSSSAGGQHALDLSDFSSECTSSVKFGAGGLKSQKSTAPHDSEHKSSTDEFPLDDPAENGPPLRRPISHVQGKLNRMAGQRRQADGTEGRKGAGPRHSVSDVVGLQPGVTRTATQPRARAAASRGLQGVKLTRQEPSAARPACCRPCTHTRAAASTVGALNCLLRGAILHT